MPAVNWHALSLAEVSGRLGSGSLTSVALTQHMLARIEQLNPTLNAFLTVTRDVALAAAEAADRDRSRGRYLGPLHGIPVAIKDNIAMAGIRMTCGSRLYADHIPERDADVVRRLRDTGAVILGKLGMHELAYGTTSDNPFFGTILNPRDHTLDAGGSSGGSASAVAGQLAFAAVGTDTACSIRFPAHCCGIAGFKPSFGAISTQGVVPLVRSLDHVGTLTRTAEDASLAFAAITGVSSPTALPVADKDRLENLRVGVVRRFFFDGDAEIRATIEESLQRLQRRGAELVELDFAGIDESVEITGRLFREAYEEFAHDLSARNNCFSASAREKFTRKSRISVADYENAKRRHSAFSGKMDALMQQCDVLLAPAATIMPARLGQWHDDYDLHASKNATVFNLAGQPSITIPVQSSSGGQPVGLMINGRRGCDLEMLNMTMLIERQLNDPPAA
ncbi:amidase [Rhizobium sp. KVB221]|uniref:Indoleacetamide hydrolase n=1 Tax=Rhizobium setariae TaxID=2801340 RepID=A0A936YMM5_9HYPH|nr:amidase [Rhizobium setariae]MBL0373334.1 amidase [Rhizobium setariae]